MKNVHKIRLSERFGLVLNKRYNALINLIIEDCNRLTHFDINFDLISNRSEKNFLKKFGSNVVLTEGSCNLSKSTYFKDESFSVETLVIKIDTKRDYERSRPFRKLSKLKFNRLDRLDLDQKYEEEWYELDVFSEQNKHLIKHLIVSSYEFEVDLITKYNNLVHLNVKELEQQFTDNEWKQIGLNCPNLKSVSLSLASDSESKTDSINNELSSLKQIKSLKRLDVQNWSKTLTFKQFNGFEGLTHLSVGSDVNTWGKEKTTTSETILEGIDVNLPNLQFLRLVSDEVKATEWTADILSRLSKLQMIQIWIEESAQPLVKTRLEKCTKIKTMKLNGKDIHSDD